MSKSLVCLIALFSSASIFPAVAGETKERGRKPAATVEFFGGDAVYQQNTAAGFTLRRILDGKNKLVCYITTPGGISCVRVDDLRIEDYKK